MKACVLVHTDSACNLWPTIYQPSNRWGIFHCWPCLRNNVHVNVCARARSFSPGAGIYVCACPCAACSCVCFVYRRARVWCFLYDIESLKKKNNNMGKVCEQLETWTTVDKSGQTTQRIDLEPIRFFQSFFTQSKNKTHQHTGKGSF